MLNCIIRKPNSNRISKERWKKQDPLIISKPEVNCKGRLVVSENGAHRILFLTADLGGGTGNHLLSMIKYWDKSRWRAEILSQAWLTARVFPDAPIEFLTSRHWFDRFPLSQVLRLAKIQQYIGKHTPDLMHCYFFWSIIYGRILKQLGKIRILVENREDLGFSWGKEAYALLRMTRSIPDRVICVSEAVRRVALEKERLDPARTVVVHNGVEPIQRSMANSSAVRRELGITEDNLVVGMVANFNRPIKGASYFLDAIPSIVQAVPSARFLILGEGKEEQALRNKAKALGIKPYVIFAGYQKDIDRYFAVMNVSVLTSLSEGFSITVLESMSHGLPVVATKVGGNPEVVVDGVTGYLVQPKNVPEFVKRVVELLRNPELRTRMGREGRCRVKQRFQIRDAVKRYLEIYTDLLQPITMHGPLA